MDWYLTAWRNWSNFSGRSRRTEFWTFVLGNSLAASVLWFLEFTLGTFGFLSYAFSLVVIVPGLAAGVRRLHDTGRSGFWIIGAYVPVVNLLILYFLVLDSDPGPNAYGANPKGA